MLSRAPGSQGPHLLGIVTRCPLVLKLRKLEPGEEWRGKVIYDDIEVELSDPSQVEEAINKGWCPIVPYPLTACQPCLESEEKCRVILSGPCSSTHKKRDPLNLLSPRTPGQKRLCIPSQWLWHNTSQDAFQGDILSLLDSEGFYLW